MVASTLQQSEDPIAVALLRCSERTPPLVSRLGAGAGLCESHAVGGARCRHIRDGASFRGRVGGRVAAAAAKGSGLAGRLGGGGRRDAVEAHEGSSGRGVTEDDDSNAERACSYSRTTCLLVDAHADVRDSVRGGGGRTPRPSWSMYCRWGRDPVVFFRPFNVELSRCSQ